VRSNELSESSDDHSRDKSENAAKIRNVKLEVIFRIIVSEFEFSWEREDTNNIGNSNKDNS
jgi:hypothetical protein